MEHTTNRARISETFEGVRKLSFQEKKESALDEVKINQFLDNILELKSTLTDKTEKICALVKDIEQLTWLDDLDNESLMSINDLISSIRDLHNSLFRKFSLLKLIHSKGIAKKEVTGFKAAIDDLKDVAADLESTFFFLPNMVDFQETTNELSLL